MDLDSIKALIDRMGITRGPINSIENGKFVTSECDNIAYDIHLGWDIGLAHECNKAWKKWSLQLYLEIDSRYPNPEDREEVLETVQVEDDHWDWVLKSAVYRDEECYKWLFLISKDGIEGVCIIFHPKDSLIDGENIFYIEYVAAAPWNRNCAIWNRKISGVGSVLIKTALRYATTQLGLEYGFSLLSLPQACGYYEKIGMFLFSERNDGQLSYYEMPREASREMLARQ